MSVNEEFLDEVLQDVVALGTDHSNDPPAPQSIEEAKKAILQHFQQDKPDAYGKFVKSVTSSSASRDYAEGYKKAQSDFQQEQESNTIKEVADTLNGSGSHACYCPRSVDGGCKCALKDEYLVPYAEVDGKKPYYTQSEVDRLIREAKIDTLKEAAYVLKKADIDSVDIENKMYLSYVDTIKYLFDYAKQQEGSR
mgnify:CR=1 FL=1